MVGVQKRRSVGVSNRKDSENKVKSTPDNDQHGENDDEGGERINVVAVRVV